MNVISAFFHSYEIDHSVDLLNNIVNGIYRNIWSSSGTVDCIPSEPSAFVGLSVLSLLSTAAEVMTISGTHTPSELSIQLNAAILSNVSF